MCYFTANFRRPHALLVHENHTLRFPRIVLTDGRGFERVRQREKEW